MSSGSTEPRRRRTVARALGVTAALAGGLAVVVAVAMAAGWLPGWRDWGLPGSGSNLGVHGVMGKANTGASRIACALPPLAAQRSDAPEGMVWVPAGRLTPGDSVYPEEAGGKPVQLAGFWMDRTEVSNDQFARFVAATGYVTVAERAPDPIRLAGAPPELLRPGALVFQVPRKLEGPPDPLQWWRYLPGASWRQPGGPGTHLEGRGSLPVVAVTLEDAQAYARWVGRQLPTEAQWEWAAKEARDQATPQHEQPRQANTWQGRFPMEDAASDGFAGIAPVGCYASNALGLHDMIGNVWEWTRDAWRPGHEDAPPPALQAARAAAAGSPLAQGVIKGGSFLCSPDWCMRYRAGARQPQDLDLATSHLGFRTILEVR